MIRGVYLQKMSDMGYNVSVACGENSFTPRCRLKGFVKYTVSFIVRRALEIWRKSTLFQLYTCL